jgi:hypothetical protein
VRCGRLRQFRINRVGFTVRRSSLDYPQLRYPAALNKARDRSEAGLKDHAEAVTKMQFYRMRSAVRQPNVRTASTVDLTSK